jgi:hypothetical protein
VAPHWPRGVQGGVTAEGSKEGGYVGPFALLVPHGQAEEVRVDPTRCRARVTQPAEAGHVDENAWQSTQVRPHDQCILRTRRRRGLAGLRGVPLTARGVIPLGVDEERIGPGDAGRSQALRGTTHDRSSTTISPSARGSSNTATAFASNRRED